MYMEKVKKGAKISHSILKHERSIVDKLSGFGFALHKQAGHV